MVKDGGPAFPQQLFTQEGKLSGVYLGMTLRDYFAGQALAGILANPAMSPTEHAGLSKSAEAAYHQADAMIKERDAA